MQANPQDVVAQFAAVLEQLKDWPDKEMILSLTAMAEHNINLAAFFVEIVIARLVNPATNSSYKRPIFYLIDSIMKHVCGPFPFMFAKQFNEAYPAVLKDIHAKVDRDKLIFLLSTWGERKFLPDDLLEKMKYVLANPQPAPPSSNMFHPPAAQFFPDNFSSRSSATQAPPSRQSNRGPAPHSADIAMDPLLRDLIHTEMVNLLHKLFAEINVSQPMTLDELARANPALFNQLRANAEISARQMLASRQQAPGMRAPQLTVPASSAGLQATHGMSRKRPLPVAATQGDRYANRFADASKRGPELQNTAEIPGSIMPQDGRIVNGFICEATVTVDIARAEELQENIAQNASSAGLSNLAARLDLLLRTLHNPPALPGILFGPLPLEPLFPNMRTAHTNVQPTRKIPKPEFQMSDLATKRPDAMIKALYADQPHQFFEDGLRFRSQALLQKHSVAYFETKKFQQRRRESKDSRQFREHYCKVAQWISDFSALDKRSGLEHPTSSSGSGGGGGGGDGISAASQSATDTEEFIMPADEFFTRCPVSKERFESFWDDEEGELMFRHAVKVLVTESAEGELFRLGRPCPHESSVRYLVVHKLLVLDKWLAEGRAVSLRDAKQRYEHVEGRGQSYVQRLVSASGEEQDEGDIFVYLELSI